MGKRWILYLLALAGCIGFYVAYQGWLAWVVLWVVVSLPLMGLVISLPAMCQTTAQLICSQYPALGSAETIQFQPRCRLPMPLSRCRIQVQRPLTGERWTLRPGDPLPADHAGALLCRPENCRVYDYLGLFFLPIRRGPDAVAIVRPRPVPMAQLPSFARRSSHVWRPKPGGGYAENHELRLYRPGDPLNQIHWKLTAKTGKLTIREPMEPLTGNTIISLDLKGTAEQLDRKLGQLLWLGQQMLARSLPFQLWALTADGPQSTLVDSPQALLHQIDVLLGCRCAVEGTLQDQTFGAARHWHIGGDSDEA